MGLFDSFRSGLDALGYDLPSKYKQMAAEKSDNELLRELKKCEVGFGVDDRWIQALKDEIYERGLM